MNTGIILIGVLALAVTVVIGYFYFGIVRQQIHLANTTLGKPDIVANARGFMATLEAKLFGWKTIILAWIAGVFQVIQVALTPEVIQGFQGAPWASVLDPKVANWISIACVLLIPITHARGLATAAVTPPVDPGA